MLYTIRANWEQVYTNRMLCEAGWRHSLYNFNEVYCTLSSLKEANSLYLYMKSFGKNVSKSWEF
jgi:hypothetical protein